MGMVIHDDYWEAMKLLPKTQQAPFLMAVVRYGMEGAEPSGRPPWLATFTAIKGRIELGAKRSASGAKGGKVHKQNQDLLCKQNANLLNKQNQDLLEGQNESLLSRVEDEVEYEVEENPLKPPYGQIVGHLNERTGKSFKPTSEATRKAIRARFAEGYTLDDFLRVIDTKAAEWMGDPKMEQYLRPSTLFRPANFENYLNQAPKEAIDYGQYD